MSRGDISVPPNRKILLASQIRRKNQFGVLYTNDRRDEAYVRMAAAIQPLISLISGIPPSGQTPLVPWTMLTSFVWVGVWVLTGVLSAGIGAQMLLCGHAAAAALLVAGWMLMTGGFRATMTTVLHEIVHSLEPKCKRDSAKVYHFLIGWIGEVITILLVLPPIRSYYEEHVLNHHVSHVFCTLSDPDAAFLNKLGFRPGMTKQDLWLRFWFNLLVPISPLYRLYFLSRLRGQATSQLRIAMTLSIWSVIATIVLVGGVVGVFWLSFAVPCMFGVPAAALAQFASEHNWLVLRKAENRRQYLQKTTRGRLFMDELPALSLPPIRRTLAWCLWWLRLFLVHLPTRIMVCPFDLGAGHDLHHYGEASIRKDRNPPSWATWTNAGYFRRWVEANCAGHIELTTYWSLREALDSVFESYSKLDPNDPTIEECRFADSLPIIQDM